MPRARQGSAYQRAVTRPSSGPAHKTTPPGILALATAIQPWSDHPQPAQSCAGAYRRPTRCYIAYWNKLQSETNLKMYILAFWRAAQNAQRRVEHCKYLLRRGPLNVYLSFEGVIDGEGLGHHFLMARHKAFPLFE